MNVSDFYASIGGNYENAKVRLMSDERIEKYLKRFPSYVDLAALEKAVAEKDYQTVFAISHDIKGMCLNLELTPLSKSSSELCESVRNGAPTAAIEPLFEAFRADFADFSAKMLDCSQKP